MKCELAIMTPPNGYRTMTWDPETREGQAEAEAVFLRYTAQGYLSYRLNPSGTSGQIVKNFDPQAERLVLAPQMAGG